VTECFDIFDSPDDSFTLLDSVWNLEWRNISTICWMLNGYENMRNEKWPNWQSKSTRSIDQFEKTSGRNSKWSRALSLPCLIFFLLLFLFPVGVNNHSRYACT
jgi:hypothetical protein